MVNDFIICACEKILFSFKIVKVFLFPSNWLRLFFFFFPLLTHSLDSPPLLEQLIFRIFLECYVTYMLFMLILTNLTSTNGNCAINLIPWLKIWVTPWPEDHHKCFCPIFSLFHRIIERFGLEGTFKII